MTNYNEMKTKELRVIARQMGVKNYSSAGKAYLIPEIERIEAERKAAEEASKKTEKKGGKKQAKLYNGKTLTEWSKELIIPVPTLRARLNRGWSYDEVFTSDNHKAKGSNLYEYNGKSQNLNAWAKELGISVHTLNARINRLGWNIEKAFSTESKGKN